MYIRSPKELALFVINQRKKLGLSQTDVADRVGLKQKTISAFENHPEKAQINTVFRIFSAVELDMNAITKSDYDKNTIGWNEGW